MYKFVLMSGKWYYTSVFGMTEDLETTEDHLYQGTVVAFCDDVGTFANEMGVAVGDMVNDDDA